MAAQIEYIRAIRIPLTTPRKRCFSCGKKIRASRKTAMMIVLPHFLEDGRNAYLEEGCVDSFLREHPDVGRELLFELP